MKYWVKDVEKYNSWFSNNKNDKIYRNYWVDLIKIQTLYDKKMWRVNDINLQIIDRAYKCNV